MAIVFRYYFHSVLLPVPIRCHVPTKNDLQTLRCSELLSLEVFQGKETLESFISLS